MGSTSAAAASGPAGEGVELPGMLGVLLDGWRRVQRHPFGTLLPATCVLGIQALAASWWWRLDVELLPWLGIGLAAWGACSLVAAPLRAVLLGAGARAAGRQSPGGRRGLALVGVVSLTIVAHGAILAMVAGVWALGASLLVSYGLVSMAALYGAACLVAAVLLTFALRVRLALAPVRAVDGGLAAWRALVHPRGVPWLRAAAVLLAADALLAAGAVLAGAGALPAYAVRELALQRLWEEA